jgi:glycosyltransferase involved in cell wall biosynthesis
VTIATEKMAYMDRIDILLATYNGEKYIDPLLQSIVDQTYSNWFLYARDDGSSDGTVDKLELFNKKYPEKVKILPNNGHRCGIAGNFDILLRESTSNYIMLCDQDDVWLPDKIAISVDAVKNIELINVNNPILVHTDLYVVDKFLKRIAPSFVKYQGINANYGKSLKKEMLENVVTGCAMIINRPLADLALPIPQKCKMHDWWIAMVAAAFGETKFISRSTIFYRQHGENDVGASRWSAISAIRRGFSPRKLHNNIVEQQLQAFIFMNRYSDILKPKQLFYLKSFSELNSRSFIYRRLIAIKIGLRHNKLIRTLGFYLFL